MSPESLHLDPDQSPEEIEASMQREIEGLLELEDLDMPEPPEEMLFELGDAEADLQPPAAEQSSAPSGTQRG
jgi:hypothetical protein